MLPSGTGFWQPEFPTKILSRKTGAVQYYQSGLGYDSVTTGLALLAYTLPTLLMPPLGEKLTTRFGASRLIPLGLFTIGAGFMLMHIAVVHHLSLLPGALLAGMALGLTNTPVTNTTTGSVAANRAGMASGIDISARLITLAVNIALMGSLLVAGIAASLKKSYAGSGGTCPRWQNASQGDLWLRDYKARGLRRR